MSDQPSTAAPGTRDTPEAALAAALPNVPTAKALTRHLGEFNGAWWDRFALEVLAALPPGWCGHEVPGSPEWEAGYERGREDAQIEARAALRRQDDVVLSDQPSTAAGRALFTDMEPMDMLESDGVRPEDIVGIEAEAVAAYRADLAAKVRGLIHELWIDDDEDWPWDLRRVLAFIEGEPR